MAQLIEVSSDCGYSNAPPTRLLTFNCSGQKNLLDPLFSEESC